jgi:hypothetical protein
MATPIADSATLFFYLAGKKKSIAYPPCTAGDTTHMRVRVEKKTGSLISVEQAKIALEAHVHSTTMDPLLSRFAQTNHFQIASRDASWLARTTMHTICIPIQKLMGFCEMSLIKLIGYRDMS